jgi:ABC-2 type transport system permease protein
VSNFAALLRRELGVYFVSPMAYIVLVPLLFFSGLAFHSTLVEVANLYPMDYRGTLQTLAFMNVLMSALVTMRLIAEEKSKGTLETLLTAPVTEAQVVLAKFAASLVLMAYLILPTVGYAVIVSQYGQVDGGAVACGYLGLLLMGAVLYSIGIFISSLCSSQITAGVVTLMVSVLLLFANFFAPQLPESSTARQLLSYVNLTDNFNDFLKGVVDTSRLVYLVSVVGFFLFLTTRVVQSRRWR